MTDDIARLGFEIDSAQVEKAIKALSRLELAAIKTEKAERKLAGSSRDDALSKKRAAIETERLFSKYKSGYSDVVRFNAEFADLDKAMNGQILTAQEYSANIQKLNSAFELSKSKAISFDAALRNVGYNSAANATNMYAKSMSNANMHTANVFAQMNDIGVMMASGQNPLILAMQQGTQLNQVWGQMGGNLKSIGGALGSAFMSMLNPISLLTIGVIAGGAALVQWGISAVGAEEKTRNLEDAMSELDGVASGLNASQEIMKMSIVELIDKYGTYSLAIRQVATDLAALQIAEAQASLEKQVFDSADAFKVFTESASTAFSSGTSLSSAISNIAKELGVSKEESYKLEIAFTKVKNAASIEDRVSAFNNLNYILRETGANLDKLPPPIRKALIDAGNLSIKMGEVKRAIDLAKSAADALSNTGMGPLIGGLDTAIGKASTLATKLWDAAYAYALAAGGQPDQTEGDFPVGSKGRSAPPRPPSGIGGVDWGGKPAGGKDPYAGNLKKLIDSLKTEKEITDDWYSENLSILNDRRAMEILGEQSHKDALLDLEQQYQEKLAKFKSQEMNNTLGHYNDLFGNMASIAKAGGDKATGVVKAFSIAQGLINSYLAYTQVLADPSLVGRPFLRTALAASTLASGLAQVANMRSGGSGSASATTSATASSNVEPERVTRIDFVGEEWQALLIESLLKQVYSASKNGRVIMARA